ncbi:hypothetical protein GIB67_000015 [Kingdonia uniflora]|uniref:Pentatricopeptide repeat-containing protein n=1 Tax=Kingdonia uniflora TaxID=39325 RepID=A0A7J7MP29_9MAGN|nr:hypothetical protein GIB67_000015 [Kingdonia uniflora]
MYEKYGVVDQWLRILFDEMLEKNGVPRNVMIMHMKIALAERVFWERKGRNVLLEHIMVRGYVHNGQYHDAIKFIKEKNNFLQNFVAGHGIGVPVLIACSNLCLLLVGRQIQDLIVTLLGFQMDFKSEDGIVIISALIDMYCKCSSMEESRQVFDSVLTCMFLIRRVKILYLDGCLTLMTEGLESVVLSWVELQSVRVVSCNKIKDSEITPALLSLFSVLKELKWGLNT